MFLSPEDVQAALKGQLWQCKDADGVFELIVSQAESLNASCTAIALARYEWVATIAVWHLSGDRCRRSCSADVKLCMCLSHISPHEQQVARRLQQSAILTGPA